MNELIIEHKKKIMFFLMVCSILMFTVSILLIKYSNELSTNTVMMNVIGLLLLFSSLYMIINVIYIFFRRVKIVIDNNGFTDSTSFSSVGFTPWSEIDDIYINESYVERFVSVKLKDTYIEQMSKLQKIIFNVNKGGNLNVINLDLYTVDKEHEEVLEIMNYFWYKNKAQKDKS